MKKFALSRICVYVLIGFFSVAAYAQFDVNRSPEDLKIQLEMENLKHKLRMQELDLLIQKHAQELSDLKALPKQKTFLEQWTESRMQREKEKKSEQDEAESLEKELKTKADIGNWIIIFSVLTGLFFIARSKKSMGIEDNKGKKIGAIFMSISILGVLVTYLVEGASLSVDQNFLSELLYGSFRFGSYSDYFEVFKKWIALFFVMSFLYGAFVFRGIFQCPNFFKFFLR